MILLRVVRVSEPTRLGIVNGLLLFAFPDLALLGLFLLLCRVLVVVFYFFVVVRRVSVREVEAVDFIRFVERVVCVGNPRQPLALLERSGKRLTVAILRVTVLVEEHLVPVQMNWRECSSRSAICSSCGLGGHAEGYSHWSSSPPIVSS